MIADVIDWLLALIPVLLMAALFVWLDVFKLMSVREMVGLILLGGVAALAAWPVSGAVLDQLPMGFSTYSRMVAPWIEEALKLMAIILLFAGNRVGFKLDAVISGFAVGAGFSIVENIFYLTRYPDLTEAVWMVRGLGTAIMHGTTAAIMAAVAHELGERSARGTAANFRLSPMWFGPGYLAASVIHLVFNHFPDRPMMVMTVTLLLAPLTLLALLRFGQGETQRWLAEECAIHEAMVIAWRSGGFPNDASGRRIEAMVRRVSDEEGRRIRAYCTLKTELVLAAERELQDGDRQISLEQRRLFRDQFTEIDALRQSISRAGFAALRPLLPFSRNDEWELAELRELVGRD